MTVPNSTNLQDTPPPSIAALLKRATVDKTDMSKYSIKSLIASVGKLYNEGDFEYRRHCLDNAYVYYMKGCSIMVEVIAKHQNVKEAKRDPMYNQLMMRTSDDILDLLEKIRIQLVENDALASGQHDDASVQEVMSKYPPVDVLDSLPSSPYSDGGSLLDDLPSVPKHMPQKARSSPQTPQTPQTPPAATTTTTTAAPPQGYMKMPEPLANIPPLPQQPQQQSLGIQLPTPSNFPLPPMNIIDPSQLASWIAKRQNTPQPSVLILDVRPRQAFDQGFIKHRWVAQIEPLVLKRDITSTKIEESMLLNPEPEQIMFAGRNQFDIVVYYDQNSQSEHLVLNHLREAIYIHEYGKLLQRPPVMLAGGFEAWKQMIGDRGIYKYNNDSPVERSNQRVPHWLQDVVGKGSEQSTHFSPVKVHNTIYDYFSHTGSSNTSKESMSRYTPRTEAPPLRGVFANTLYQPSNDAFPSMPIPQPISSPTVTTETFTTKYPEIRPNSSSGLTRKKTFIDNPFHGFTSTSNKQFDVPPLPPKPHIDGTPSAPPLPPKLAMASSPPASDGYRTAPVSDNALSQMGNVMIGTAGLKNLGNTCFMNSIIQCLSGTIPFARYFLSGVFRQHINKGNFLGTGGVLAESFATLLRSMWSENCNFVSPILFRQALIQFAPQFRGSEQHDSQEFLNFLLDGIHEDCNLVVKRPSPPPETAEEEARFEKLEDWQASALAWERYLERNSSIVVSLFQGQYKSRLTCLTCRATSTTYNSFMSLSLPIPAKKRTDNVSLYQCLDYFVQEEVLENDDAWHCPRCKTLRRASKALTLSKLPDVLLIHLKRFSFDGPFKNKLETFVDSPMTGLDLSRYVPQTMFPADQPPERSAFNYDLYAVSNHFGSLTGGHYTACVRNGYKNEWHNFDDSRFSVCEPSKVMSRAAYNLFYVRSTVK